MGWLRVCLISCLVLHSCIENRGMNLSMSLVRPGSSNQTCLFGMPQLDGQFLVLFQSC